MKPFPFYIPFYGFCFYFSTRSSIVHPHLLASTLRFVVLYFLPVRPPSNRSFSCSPATNVPVTTTRRRRCYGSRRPHVLVYIHKGQLHATREAEILLSILRDDVPDDLTYRRAKPASRRVTSSLSSESPYKFLKRSFFVKKRDANVYIR